MNDIEYAEAIIKPLLNSPEKLNVARTVDEMGVLLTIDVDKEDMGKLLGREGKTAAAIRSILRVYGAKSNARISIKINEPDGGKV